MSNQIKTYWASLEPRERMVLGYGSVAVVLILFYALIWQPWQASLAFMDKSVTSMRVDAVWMEQRAAQMAQGGGSSKGNQPRLGAGQSLLSVVEKTAKEATVRGAIQQIVPNQANGDVRVVLESVDFNQWVKWVDNLYKNYGVDISQINAEKDDEKPNLAEIRVTFFRG